MSNKDKNYEFDKDDNEEKLYDGDEDLNYESTTEDGEELDSSGKIKAEKDKLKGKLEKRITELERERDEYLNSWKRIQADYANREREIKDSQEKVIRLANVELIRDILPILDGYDSARANTKLWESVSNDWRTGVEYLFSHLLQILEKYGVAVYGKVGDTYDPLLYEAVETVDLTLENEKDDGKIVDVLQKGYKIGDKILRVARVKVGHLEK